jgi:hypothetical protein
MSTRLKTLLVVAVITASLGAVAVHCRPRSTVEPFSLVGKSEAEVRELVGQPATNVEGILEHSKSAWYYDSFTVYFQDGRAYRVSEPGCPRLADEHRFNETGQKK